MRKCIKCNVLKNLEEFPKDKNLPQGRKASCNNCYTQQMREYHSKNPHIKKRNREQFKLNKPNYYREYALKTVYGISLEAYNTMLRLQNNACYICKKTFINSPHVDHCHKMKHVRKLLCKNCNQALGLLKEDIDTLQNMIYYIKEHGENL